MLKRVALGLLAMGFLFTVANTARPTELQFVRIPPNQESDINEAFVRWPFMYSKQTSPGSRIGHHSRLHDSRRRRKYYAT